MENNGMKLQTLAELENLVEAANAKVKVLAALDADLTTTGVGDLNDQLETLVAQLNGLARAVDRAKQVVPN